MSHRTGANDLVTPGDSPVTGEALVARFAPTTLDALGKARLEDRTDVKFLVPTPALADLLAPWSTSYRVLEIEGRRSNRYATTYYDSPDLMLYHHHRVGRLPRQKVRMRHYVESGFRFLELKTKTIHGRTVKSRVLLEAGEADLARLGALPLPEALRAQSLIPSLEVRYTRITLVHLHEAERITLDVGIQMLRGGATTSLGDVAIIEVKRAGGGRSPFLDATRHWSRHASGLSKYCLGIAALVPGVKRHRLLPALRRIRSLDAAA